MKNGHPKIEKGIEIPPRAGRGNGTSDLLRSMKKGDSILLPIKQVNAANRAQYVFGPGNYATRAEGNGTRIWRTA